MNKKGIDFATIMGASIGLGSLILAVYLEFNELNPDLGSQFLKVSALLIIFGGTLGATMLSFSLAEIMKLPKLFAIAFTDNGFKPANFVALMVKFATIARKDGILRLEDEAEQLGESDIFLAKGLRLVIDGTDVKSVEEMLYNEIEAMEERHKVGFNIFQTMGGYAPTMGIIGTVIGLIGALAKAGHDTGESSAIVAAIATAFIATFYGIASANLFFLPLASKLKNKSDHEAFIMNVIIDAILSLQAGHNPRIVHDKLKIFFKRDEVPEWESREGK
jgi:chemotaxis protein MotA